MIKLLDLIEDLGVSIGKFKIHFAQSSSSNPLDEFFSGNFKEWQECQGRQNFKCNHIISLIQTNKSDEWLFAGLFSVDRKPKKISCDSTCPAHWRDSCSESWKSRHPTGCYQYFTSEIPGLEELVGKVIIKFKKKFQTCYVSEKYKSSLIVNEIRGQRMSIGDFPGYNSVCLHYQELCTIVREEIKSWKTALSNVKDVYVIADKSTGKLYVGKADGEKGIWQRWIDYTKNGHGEDKKLKEKIESNGQEYANNWQFSILRVCDIDANEDIGKKEEHWKEVLLTRKYGYN